MIDQTEIWRPISGFEGLYEISNHGRVKSLARIVPKGYKNRACQAHAEMILKPCLIGYEYRVALYDNKPGAAVRNANSRPGIKKLVWETFVGPRPPKHVLRCIDGNDANCRLDNLKLVSRADLLRENSP